MTWNSTRLTRSRSDEIKTWAFPQTIALIKTASEGTCDCEWTDKNWTFISAGGTPRLPLPCQRVLVSRQGILGWTFAGHSFDFPAHVSLRYFSMQRWAAVDQPIWHSICWRVLLDPPWWIKAKQRRLPEPVSKGILKEYAHGWRMISKSNPGRRWDEEIKGRKASTRASKRSWTSTSIMCTSNQMRRLQMPWTPEGGSPETWSWSSSLAMHGRFNRSHGFACQYT